MAQLGKYVYVFAVANICFLLLINWSPVKANLRGASFGETSLVAGSVLLAVGAIYFIRPNYRFPMIPKDPIVIDDTADWFYSLFYIGFWLVIWGLLLGRRTERFIRDNSVVGKLCFLVGLFVLIQSYFQPIGEDAAFRMASVLSPIMLIGYTIFFLAAFNNYEGKRLCRLMIFASFLMLPVSLAVVHRPAASILFMGDSRILRLVFAHFSILLFWSFSKVVGVGLYGFVRRTRLKDVGNIS